MPRHADFVQRFLHLVELERLDDRFDLLHRYAPDCLKPSPCRRAVRPDGRLAPSVPAAAPSGNRGIRSISLPEIAAPGRCVRNRRAGAADHRISCSRAIGRPSRTPLSVSTSGRSISDRIDDHRVEDRLGVAVLERLGAVLGHAQALARRHAGAVVEADEFRAGGRGLEIFDDRRRRRRPPAAAPAPRAISSSADCGRSSPSRAPSPSRLHAPSRPSIQSCFASHSSSHLIV